ncbi:MAG: DUF2520 domain-containing protein [Ferrimicrobium sp.]
MRTIRFIGRGNAGLSLAYALKVSGWSIVEFLGRGDNVARAATGVDVLVISTPDDAVAKVAKAVRPEQATVVLHLSGSLGLGVLADHPRRGKLHPLAPLPDADIGSHRLLAGITFAVEGDQLATELAESLGGQTIVVSDANRSIYHAAACIAANHVVALLGQVERVAATAGLPLSAFIDLARWAVEDTAAVGPGKALTGPAARGDWVTLKRHLEALEPDELPGYKAGSDLALRLAASESSGRSPRIHAPDPVEPVLSEACDVRTKGETPRPSLVDRAR